MNDFKDKYNQESLSVINRHTGLNLHQTGISARGHVALSDPNLKVFWAVLHENNIKIPKKYIHEIMEGLCYIYEWHHEKLGRKSDTHPKAMAEEVIRVPYFKLDQIEKAISIIKSELKRLKEKDKKSKEYKKNPLYKNVNISYISYEKSGKFYKSYSEKDFNVDIYDAGSFYKIVRKSGIEYRKKKDNVTILQ